MLKTVGRSVMYVVKAEENLVEKVVDMSIIKKVTEFV